MDILTTSVLVIAICMVLTSAAVIITSVMAIKLIMRIHSLIDKVDAEISPTIHKASQTAKTFLESFDILSDITSIVKKIRNKR